MSAIRSKSLSQCQHDEPGQLGGCRDEQVGHRGSAVQPLPRENSLHLDRAGFDGRVAFSIGIDASGGPVTRIPQPAPDLAE